MQVNAGQIICREGEASDAIYMVLHGRLRTIHEKKEGQIEILGEFGQGDSVGELEVLSKFHIRKNLCMCLKLTRFFFKKKSWCSYFIYASCYS